MAKNAMTPEEQLEDLQRRFQLLEGESLWPFWSLRDFSVCILCVGVLLELRNAKQHTRLPS